MATLHIIKSKIAIPEDRAKLHEWKEKRLKAGLHLPDYKYASLPSYWRTKKGTERQRKPQSYEDILRLAKPHECPWQFETWDALTGEVYERSCFRNVITDVGGISLLKNLWNSSGSAVGIMNHVVASPNGASSTLTSATGTLPITSLAINALPAALSSGATLVLGFGGGTTQTVTLSSGASLGATSLTVTSFTPTINYPIGTAIVANPNVTDNPSSVSGSVDSGALSSGAFTYNSTSGTGNRTCQIVATLTGTTGNAGNYTECYTSNAGTIASNSTASHVIFPAFVLNGSTNETITLVERA
jgi:hypothetical protein